MPAQPVAAAHQQLHGASALICILSCSANCAAHPTASAGVQLAYGQKTGYGSYGPFPAHPMRRGARVVLLQQGGDSSTWLRQEGGSLVRQAAAAAEENSAAWVRQQASCLVENS